LGPNEWDDGVTVLAPLWVESILGGLPSPFTPKHIREAAAIKIEAESRGNVRAIIMDPKDQHPGEDDATFFQRLEKEHNIETYFFVMPLNCKPHGLTFEAGMIQRDFQWGRNPAVLLFVQEGVADVDDKENWNFKEKGHRTRYLSSFAGLAHNVQPWKNIEIVVDDIVSWALVEDNY
jgi:hypothetical protein